MKTVQTTLYITATVSIGIPGGQRGPSDLAVSLIMLHDHEGKARKKDYHEARSPKAYIESKPL